MMLRVPQQQTTVYQATEALMWINLKIPDGYQLQVTDMHY